MIDPAISHVSWSSQLGELAELARTAFATEWDTGLRRSVLAAELSQLPGPYAAPDGALFFGTLPDRTRDPSAPAIRGCVGLRAASDPICELRLLIAEPRDGAARLLDGLIAAALTEAARIGYARMLADTALSMPIDDGVWLRHGFRPTAPDLAHPVAGARILARDV